MIFKKKTERPDSTAVSNEFIKRSMPLMPELALKVYLFGLMLSSGEDGDIASALGADEKDIRAALSYLEGLGLVELADGPEPVVIFKKPEEYAYTAAEGGAKYADFVKELQAVLGTRTLTGQELSRIYDWIELFGFEKEAAAAIVGNCLDMYGAKTGIAFMDKVAKTLAGRGAFTLAAVNEHFRRERIMTSGAAAVRRRWNRSGAPTQDEIALYEKWTVEWGMDEAAIDYALTRMTAADNPSFKYLDGVLGALREGGNTDAGHIRELSRREDELDELVRKMFAEAGLKSRPKREQKELIRSWRYEYLMSEELLLLAAGYAKADVSPFARMRAIVSGWHGEGISTEDAARASYEKNGGFSERKRRPNRALGYMQGKTYSEDELKKMGITLGEEFYDDEDKQS